MVGIHESRESKILAVRQGQEVVVRMRNNIGVLFELSTLVSRQGVNILSVNGEVHGEECVVRLITDDHRKTQEVLTEYNFAPQEESVILVELPHRPEMLKQVAKILTRAGVDIRRVYAAATPEQDQCLVVFHTSDDEEALVKLRESE